MNKLRGLYVPIVTPFADGAVDERGLRRLIRYLIGQGVDGLVACGTTGEAATLSRDERRAVIEITVEEAAGQVPVIAGIGGNDTRAMLAEIEQMNDLGADSLMIVCPYYNRPSQSGLVAHFRALAAATPLPVILYNIPQRTAVNLEPQSVVELSTVENIIGIKEASSSLEQLAAIIADTSDDFSVVTGEDTLVFPSLCLGADGAISAAGNVLAGEYVQMIRAFQQGDLETARQIHYQVRPMLRALFAEPNPGPMKTALHLMGICNVGVRLPLLPASDDCAALLRRQLERLGKLSHDVSRA